MAIDWDLLIKEAENELVRMLSKRVVGGLVSKVTWLAGLSGPLSFLVGILIGQIVKYGDLLTFYLGVGWMNSENAKDYQKAGEDLANLPPTATQEEIDRAKKAKADALDRLFGVP